MHQDDRPRKAVPAQSTILPFTALIVANVALAFGPWFVRMSDTGPVAAAFWRMMLAAPVLFGASLLLRQQPIRRARGLWWVLALSGLAFAADLGSWHAGILRTTLANSTLFGNVATLMFPVYGFIVARAWPTRLQATALGLAATGGGLLLGRSAELSPQHLAGDVLCLGAGLFYTVYFILMSRVRETMAPLPALALSSIASLLPLLAAAWMLGESILPRNWGVLVALALVSQVFGQGLMIYALGKLSPLVVGLGLLTQPVVAGAIGWGVYGERLGGLDFVGAGLVAIALVLVRKGGRTPVQLAPVGAQGQRKTHG